MPAIAPLPRPLLLLSSPGFVMVGSLLLTADAVAEAVSVAPVAEEADCKLLVKTPLVTAVSRVDVKPLYNASAEV